MASAIPGAGLVGWIADALSEGISQRATIRTLRDAGFKFGDAKFRSIWGQTRASMGAIEQVQGITGSSLPRDDQYSEWGTLRGRGFATHITYTRREKGITEVQTGSFLHMTNEPHTPDEAFDAMFRTFEEPEDADKKYDFEVLGGLVTGIYKQVPL